MIVMETIEQLKKIELENSTPDDVRKILYESPLPAIKSVITKGTYIIRARKGDGYTKRSQMTYCPVEFCKSLQRATLNGQTMFYGVIQMINPILKMHVQYLVLSALNLLEQVWNLLVGKNLPCHIGKWLSQ